MKIDALLDLSMLFSRSTVVLRRKRALVVTSFIHPKYDFRLFIKFFTLFILCSFVCHFASAQIDLKEINTEAKEYCPVMDASEQQLFFARSGHDQNIGRQNLADVWVSHKLPDGNWSRATNLGALVNSNARDFPIAVVRNGHRLYISSDRQGADFPLLYRSDREGSQWNMVEPVVIDDHYSYHREVSYAVSFDAAFCLLAAERDEGAGGLDIYVATRLREDHYSTPQPLSHINTDAHESHPCLSADGQTLYFLRSLQGETSVWMSRKLSQDGFDWSKPERIPHMGHIPTNGIFISPTHPYMWIGNEKGNLDKHRLTDDFLPNKVYVVGGKVVLPESTLLQMKLYNAPSQLVLSQSKVTSGPFQIQVPESPQSVYLCLEAPGYIPYIALLQYKNAAAVVKDRPSNTEFVLPDRPSEDLDIPLAQARKEMERIRSERARLRQRMKREQYQQQEVRKKLSLKMDPTLERLRHDYQQYYGGEEEVVGTLDQLKNTYRAYANDEKQTVGSKITAAEPDELSNMKSRFLEYARTDEPPIEKSERQELPSPTSFQELWTDAQQQAIHHIWRQYLLEAAEEKADHPQLRYIQLSAPLVEMIQSVDQDFTQHCISQSASVQYQAAHYSMAMFSVHLKDLMSELLTHTQEKMYRHYHRTLRQQAYTEVDFCYDLAVLDLLESKLQQRIDRLHLQRLMAHAVRTRTPMPNSLLIDRPFRNLDNIKLTPAKVGQRWSLSEVAFSRTQEDLLSESSYAELYALAEVLRMLPNLNLCIEVSLGDLNSHRRAIKKLQAQRIQHVLVQQGIEEQRISIATYDESKSSATALFSVRITNI